MFNSIVSLSGGKDSTATALVMAEQGIFIHSLAYFETGWDFEQIKESVHKLAEYIGVPLIILKPKYDFYYWMLEKPIIAAKGPMIGKVHRIGNGWPSLHRRWCTREKVSKIEQYSKSIEAQTGITSISCIGFAYDEQHRLLKKI